MPTVLKLCCGEVAAVVAPKLHRCPDAREVAPDGVDEAAGGRVAVLERDHVRPAAELVSDNQEVACVDGAEVGVYLLKRS